MVFIQSLCRRVRSHFSLLDVTVLAVIGYQIQSDTKAGGDHCGLIGILIISQMSERFNKKGFPSSALPSRIAKEESMSTPDFDVGVILNFDGGVTTSYFKAARRSEEVFIPDRWDCKDCNDLEESDELRKDDEFKRETLTYLYRKHTALQF
ncbi:hypothetical protein Bca4012_076202 [Brassica carinata]